MAASDQQQKSKMPFEDKIKQLPKNPVAVCFLAMICCALWGSAFPVIKIGYELLDIKSYDYASQILFAGIRFTVSGILTVIFGSIISKKILIPKRNNIIDICTLSLFQTVLQYLFFYIGLAHTTGTKSSIINSTSVFFAVLISSLIFRQEKLSLKKAAGCIIGFAGVVLINISGGEFESGMTFFGEGFIILSSVSYAFSSTLIKKFSQNENSFVLSGYQFAAGGTVMIFAGIILGGKINAFTVKSVLLLLYLSFLSAVAYTLWGILLKYNDVSKIAAYGFMTPVFGCLFSALILKESLADSYLKTIVSLVLVSAGIIIVNKNNKKKVAGND